MARTQGSTQSTIEIRRRRVQRLLADGLGAEAIADQLRVSVATIKRDVQRVQQENLRTLRGMDSEVLGAELWQRYLRRRSTLAALRREYRNHPNLQIRAVQEEAEQDGKFLAMMQGLGLVYRAPQEVQFTERLLRAIEVLTPEQMGELEAMDERQFGEWLRRQGVLPERQPELRLMPGA